MNRLMAPIEIQPSDLPLRRPIIEARSAMMRQIGRPIQHNRNILV
jgi:hypothetical protein